MKPLTEEQIKSIRVKQSSEFKDSPHKISNVLLSVYSDGKQWTNGFGLDRAEHQWIKKNEVVFYTAYKFNQEYKKGDPWATPRIAICGSVGATLGCVKDRDDIALTRFNRPAPTDLDFVVTSLEHAMTFIGRLLSTMEFAHYGRIYYNHKTDFVAPGAITHIRLESRFWLPICIFVVPDSKFKTTSVSRYMPPIQNLQIIQDAALALSEKDGKAREAAKIQADEDKDYDEVEFSKVDENKVVSHEFKDGDIIDLSNPFNNDPLHYEIYYGDVKYNNKDLLMPWKGDVETETEPYYAPPHEFDDSDEDYNFKKQLPLQTDEDAKEAQNVFWSVTYVSRPFCAPVTNFFPNYNCAETYLNYIEKTLNPHDIYISKPRKQLDDSTPVSSAYGYALNSKGDVISTKERNEW